MTDTPTSTADSSNDEPLTFGRMLLIARKHLALIVACWVAVVAVTLFWTLGQPKIYRSAALLRLDPDPPKPLGTRVELLQESGNYWSHREFYESEYRVMRSMRVATATVNALGLNADPNFLRVKVTDRSKFKPVSVSDAAQILIGRTSVEPVKDSSLAIIRYEDTDPKRAQQILNAIVHSYLAQNLDATTVMSTDALEWLNAQLEHLKVDLEKSEVALNDFRQKNNVLSISLEDRHNLIAAQLDQLAKQRTDLEVKMFDLAARDGQLARLKSTEPDKVPATELLQSGVLSKLRTDYSDAKRDLDETQANLGASHPKVLAAQAKVETLAKAILAEIENIKGAVRRDLAAVRAQIGDVEKKEDDLQKQAHELQAFEVPYNQLARTRDENAKIYGLVLERTRETELTRVMRFNNVRAIDDADEPHSPYKPNTPLNLGVGIILGILVGLGTALARELADRSLKTPSDVESYVGVSCLGLLPEISSGQRSRRRVRGPVTKLLDRDLIVAHHPEGGVAEAARAIRTNLTFMSPDRPYRSTLVTSAVPEEGKTTVACSLATVLAQSGLRVLLVDTDLRRPRLHRTFQLSNDVGITMVISNQATLDDSIRESTIQNLWVLTSGPLPPNPAEILQSAHFERLTKELLQRFDRVIYDSPPILPVTDATVLSHAVDGVVVVARAFRTPKTAARQGVKQLTDVKAHVIGLILNAVELERSDYREYHYYYKREGYYSSRPSPPSDDSGVHAHPPAA